MPSLRGCVANMIEIVASLLLIAVGVLIGTRAERIGAAVSQFYGGYPLVRLAGPQQMKIRKAYVVAGGAVLSAVGVMGLIHALI